MLAIGIKDSLFAGPSRSELLLELLKEQADKLAKKQLAGSLLSLGAQISFQPLRARFIEAECVWGSGSGDTSTTGSSTK